MFKDEADLTIRFLENAKEVLSNEKMLQLCAGVNISIPVKTEADLSVLESVQEHWDKSFRLWEKELGV